MAKHTPGPWAFSEGSPGNSEYPPDSPEVGPEDSDETVCWVNDGYAPRPRFLANGHLIAAAPELLDNLRAVLKAWHREAHMGDGFMVEHAPVWEAAQAAVRKATQE